MGILPAPLEKKGDAGELSDLVGSSFLVVIADDLWVSGLGELVRLPSSLGVSMGLGGGFLF